MVHHVYTIIFYLTNAYYPSALTFSPVYIEPINGEERFQLLKDQSVDSEIVQKQQVSESVY